MTAITFCLVLLLGLAAHPAPEAAAMDVVYQTGHPLGVKTHIVIVDLNSPSIAVEMALPRGGVGRSETFGSIVSRTKPVAAITGTFFCTQSLVPVGDIIMNGQRIHGGAIGSGVLFTADNKMRIIPAQKGKSVDWTGCATGVRAGPQLVAKGEVSINAYREGFRDKALFGRRTRAAVGVTEHNKLLLVAVKTPVTLTELAKVLRSLGAVDAINLDGGSSTGLAFGDQVIVRPGRKMTNVIAITRRTEQRIARPEAEALPSIHIASNPSERIHISRISSHPSYLNTADQKAEKDVDVQTPEQYALLPDGSPRRETR